MRNYYSLVFGALILPTVGNSAVTTADNRCVSQVHNLRSYAVGADNLSLSGKRIISEAASLKSVEDWNNFISPAGKLSNSFLLPAAPTGNEPYISEPPAGESLVYVKSGLGYGYSAWSGMWSAYADGSVINVVIADDGKTVYMDNPFSQVEVAGWLEGNLENGVVTLDFPQVVTRMYYEGGENGERYQYDEYCMLLEFVPSEDDPDSGWYYPAENQSFRFTMEADGTLVPESSSIMFGRCLSSASQDNPEERDWRWTGTGDCVFSISPLTEKGVEIPESTVFEDWNLIDANLYYDIKVGVSGDRIYIKGLFTYGDRGGLSEAAVEGVITGDKVVIDGACYLGVDRQAAATAWFVPGEVEERQTADGGIAKYFKITDSLILDYDRENKILSSDKAYCISQSPEHLNVYMYQENVYMAWHNPEAVVQALKDPVIYSFYPEMPEYGYPGELTAWVPIVSAEKIPLDTSKLFYNLIVDDEVFTFYPDEYTGLEEEMTDIPFGFSDDVSLDFCPLGITEVITIYFTGYESLGFRGVYKDGDREIYSKTVYAVTGDTAVPELNEQSEIRTTVFYDLQGRVVTNPENGLYICRTVYANGMSECKKVVIRR